MCLQADGCIRGADCSALFSRSGPVPQGDHAVLPHGRATPLMRITAICFGNALEGHSITFRIAASREECLVTARDRLVLIKRPIVAAAMYLGIFRICFSSL